MLLILEHTQTLKNDMFPVKFIFSVLKTSVVLLTGFVSTILTSLRYDALEIQIDLIAVDLLSP